VNVDAVHASKSIKVQTMSGNPCTAPVESTY